MCVSFEHDKHFMLWNELAKHPLKSKRQIFEELGLENSQEEIDQMNTEYYGCYACKYAMQKNYIDTNCSNNESRNCIENCPLEYNRQKVYDFIEEKQNMYQDYEYVDGDCCLGGLFKEFIEAARDAKLSKVAFDNSIMQGRLNLSLENQYKNNIKKASHFAKMIRDLPVRNDVQIKNKEDISIEISNKLFEYLKKIQWAVSEKRNIENERKEYENHPEKFQGENVHFKWKQCELFLDTLLYNCNKKIAEFVENHHFEN